MDCLDVGAMIAYKHDQSASFALAIFQTPVFSIDPGQGKIHRRLAEITDWGCR